MEGHVSGYRAKQVENRSSWLIYMKDRRFISTRTQVPQHIPIVKTINPREHTQSLAIPCLPNLVEHPVVQRQDISRRLHSLNWRPTKSLDLRIGRYAASLIRQRLSIYLELFFFQEVDFPIATTHLALIKFVLVGENIVLIFKITATVAGSYERKKSGLAIFSHRMQIWLSSSGN